MEIGAIFVFAIVAGISIGVAVKWSFDRLTPIDKYVKMAAKARKYDAKAWHVFEKEMAKKHTMVINKT